MTSEPPVTWQPVIECTGLIIYFKQTPFSQHQPQELKELNLSLLESTMVTEEAPFSLDLSLYEIDPDQNDVFCKALLQALADGTKEPAEVAHELDAWVMRESTRRLEELRSRPELIEWNDTISSPATTPSASGLTDRFFHGFPRVCALFSPHHPGQARIVEFLEALLAMPTHNAPDYFCDADNLSNVVSITLWRPGVVQPERFRIYDAGMFPFSLSLFLSSFSLSLICPFVFPRLLFHLQTTNR